MFSYKFCEIFRSIFFHKTLLVAACLAITLMRDHKFKVFNPCNTNVPFLYSFKASENIGLNPLMPGGNEKVTHT